MLVGEKWIVNTWATQRPVPAAVDPSRLAPVAAGAAASAAPAAGAAE